MDSTAPILSGRDEIRMWKNICSLEKGAIRKKEKNLKKMDSLIKDIQSSKGDVNPNILGKMMDVAYLYNRKDLDSIILGLLGKCKLSDCALQLKAVKLLLEQGAFDNARSVLDRITIITDIAQWEYYKGQIDIHDGNNDSAMRHFLRSFEFDNSFLDVYIEIERLDPGKGWMSRRRIESVRKGRSADQAATGSVLDDVYNAYVLADNGDFNAAIESLKHLDGSKSGNYDITLALARISAADRSYQRSIEFYESIANESRFSVRLELADVYIKNGEMDKAFDLLKLLEVECSADRRLMETRIRGLVAVNDKEGLQKYIKMYLFNDYADHSAYVLCIESAIELSMHTEASKLIVTMSAVDSDMPEANLLSSKNEFKAGRYQQALPYARRAVRKMPDDNECQLHLSMVYLALKRTKEARKHVDIILKKEPENLDALIRKKDICKAEGNSNEVSDLCKKILDRDPRDADVLKDLAQVLDGQGKHDEALRRFGEALDVRRDPVLFSKIILSLAEQGRFDEAIDIISRYDDMYGDITETWIVKGNCEYSIGRFYDASDSYKRSLEIDHNNSHIWHSKGMADEAAGVLDDAEIAYDKAVLMDLDNKEYWISKASVHEKKGEYPQAIDSYNRVISLHPDNVYALMRKAMLLVRLGKINEALFFIELAHKISPDDMKILAVQRDIYFHEGETDKCRDICRRILDADNCDVGSWVVLARICMINGLYGEAIKYLTEADRLRPSDIAVLKLLRESYHNLGDFESEMSACKVILSKSPDDREIRLALADVYMKSGLVDAAKKILNDLNDETPNDPEISLRKAKMAMDESVAMTVLLDTLADDPNNVELLLEIANMKISDGDTDQALVYLDRAIEADPSLAVAYLKKTRILLSLGEYQKVIDLLNGSMHLFKEPDPIMWQLMGDAQAEVGDISNALISYDSAIKLGLTTSEMHCKRGTVQESLGMYDAALDSYYAAHTIDQNDPVPVEHIVGLNIKKGNMDAASRDIERSLSAGMVSGNLLYLRARIQAARMNKEGIRDTLDMCLVNDVPNEYTEKVRDLLNEMESPVTTGGQSQEDPFLEQNMDAEQPVQSEDQRHLDIAKYAFLILQISNDTGKAPSDSEVLAQSGVPSDMVDDVFAYLSDIREYGDINVGSVEFKRMEELSYRAVIGSSKDDLESEPLISLATAYFKSGAYNLEEAKKLVAYIHKAVTMDLVPDRFNDSITDAVSDIERSSGDITLYSVMKRYGLGIYSARTVKMLSVKGGQSVIDHI